LNTVRCTALRWRNELSAIDASSPLLVGLHNKRLSPTYYAYISGLCFPSSDHGNHVHAHKRNQSVSE
jgi:hypothetical protein